VVPALRGHGHGHAGLWRAQVMEQGRGGGGGDCRRGRLIARWFAGAAPVVGRRLCIAIFEGGERLL